MNTRRPVALNSKTVRSSRRIMLSAMPTIYIARSSHTDQSQAAEGRENWFILVHAPSVSHGVASDYAQVVLQRLEAFGIRPDVREMYVRTSVDMAREWSTEGGALYGASSNSMFSAFLRPRQRSSQHRNLWYVGGSAHPGGGIPLVTISGSIAADLITYQDQHS